MRRNGILIDDIALDDINELYEIEKEAFFEPWKKDYFYAVYYGKNTIFKKSIFHKTIIGYQLSILEHNAMHIINLAVKSNFRRHGVGLLLINDLLQLSKKYNCKIIYLEVRETNLSALNLYTKLGFVKIVRLNNYYPNGEHGFFMAYIFDQK